MTAPLTNAVADTGPTISRRGQEGAQVADALPDLGDRALTPGCLGQDGVLLQDVPAVVAAGPQVADDSREVDVAAAQRAVHASADPFGVGQPAGPDLGRDLVVDVLEVGVGD